jgi:hypothetical protein
MFLKLVVLVFLFSATWAEEDVSFTYQPHLQPEMFSRITKIPFCENHVAKPMPGSLNKKV